MFRGGSYSYNFNVQMVQMHTQRKQRSFIKKCLGDKILQLEKISYKDQPTEVDRLTLQI